MKLKIVIVIACLLCRCLLTAQISNDLALPKIDLAAPIDYILNYGIIFQGPNDYMKENLWFL